MHWVADSEPLWMLQLVECGYSNGFFLQEVSFPHPESLKFPPRYKYSVFCGPLANFQLLNSQSPENYTMSESRLVHHQSSFTDHASKFFDLIRTAYLPIFHQLPLKLQNWPLNVGGGGGGAPYYELYRPMVTSQRSELLLKMFFCVQQQLDIIILLFFTTETIFVWTIWIVFRKFPLHPKKCISEFFKYQTLSKFPLWHQKFPP